MGAGIAGMPGLAVAKGHDGAPCHKEFSCEYGTYVKFEFVIKTDNDGITDCYFEEETDTDLITIDSYESKEGKMCEPTSVEWSVADGYGAFKMEAYGGQACVSAEDPDPSQTFEPGLEGPGGNTAAISNLQFCLEKVIPIPEGGNTSVGYEDLSKGGGNDYDYNDWLVHIDTEARGTVDQNGNIDADSITFEFVPQARGAGADHQFRVNFPEDSFCDASWTLTYEDVDGSGTAPADRSGDFTTTSGRDIEIFNRTSDVLPRGANTDADFGCECCVQPDYSATLTIAFDGQCELDQAVSSWVMAMAAIRGAAA